MKVEEIERLLAEFYEGNTTESQVLRICRILKQPIGYTVQLAVVGQKLIFKTFSIHELFLYLNPVYWLYLLIRRKETEVCYKENDFYTKMRQKFFLLPHT